MKPVEPTRRGGPGAAQLALRRQNLASVLRQVADAEPLSRAAVAQRTGLTRGTVSSLVEELIALGLVTELAAIRGGTGRPANPLQLNRAGPAGLGLEIGVDEIGACVVDLSGAVRASRRVPSQHRDRDPADGLDRAADLAASVIAEAGLPIDGVGVALHGVIGPDGQLQRAPNLPRWVDVAVDAELGARLGLPVDVGNEADLAAMAELWFGVDRPADFVYVSGGIGVGAGIVLGGELFQGPGRRAGELGHVVVEPSGPACSCGGRGCLEQLAGQEAVLRTGVADVARALGVALVGVINLFDVPTILLGGLYAQLGPRLQAAVTTELRTRLPSRPEVDVRLSNPDTGGALRAAAASVVRRRLRNP